MLTSPTSDLSRAAETGDAKAVKAALGAGADPAEVDGGTTPLHRAAFEGHKAVVKTLLGAGVAADLEDPRGFRALQLAASRDHAPVLKLLIESGAQVDAGLQDGGTLLHVAAAQGCTRVLKPLLEAGLEVMSPDRFGAPAFFYAALHGHKKSFSALLGAGSDPTAVDSAGVNALFYALRGALNARVESWRSEGNIDGVPVAYEIVDGEMTHFREGRSRWMNPKSVRLIADRHCPEHARYMDRLDMAVKLFREGADPEVRDSAGWTPVLLACALGLELAGTMILKGADPLPRLEDGRGAAHLVAACGKYQGIRNFRVALEKRKLAKDEGFLSELNAPDGRGWNPVHHLAVVDLREQTDMYRTEGVWMGLFKPEQLTARSTAEHLGVPAGSTPKDVALALGKPVVRL